ncbi:MAG: hypothetical protein OEW39_07800 [Deltaproteobacteria bacterium]|nr:hypothetical protein [Deltaproteobacteria bacterium]
MKPFRTLLLGLLLVSQAAAIAAYADEAGMNLIYNQDLRPVSEDYPGSMGLVILRLRDLVFWERAWDERQQTRVVAEKERYSLRSGADVEYFSLGLTKWHPRHTLRRDLWAVDAGLVSLSVDRKQNVYAPAPGDDRTKFYLPSLVADYTPGAFHLRAGTWTEYDILPMDYHTYSLVLNTNRLVSLGYAPDSRTEARVSLLGVERAYPTGFQLPRRDLQLELRLSGPMGEEAAPTTLRSLEGSLTLKRYPLDGTAQREFMVKGVVRLLRGRFTHFLVPSLHGSSLFTVYRTGMLPESLRETQQPGLNASAQLDYEGFTRLESLPLVLAWGGTWREPLLREIRRQKVAHLKLTWVY